MNVIFAVVLDEDNDELKYPEPPPAPPLVLLLTLPPYQPPPAPALLVRTDAEPPSPLLNPEVWVPEYEIVVEEAQTVTLSEFEPGDFVSETVAKNVVTNKVSQVQVDSPTSERVETMAETMPETTLKVFDAPIIEEETSAAESEVASQESAEETEEKKEISDEEDGKGSKGGEDAEKEEDMTGDDGENESLGNADNHGKYHLETEGDYAGKKLFELERNGNIGLDPEHLSVTNMKGMMTAVMTLLFLLGALTFVLGTRDKIKKNNYF